MTVKRQLARIIALASSKPGLQDLAVVCPWFFVARFEQLPGAVGLKAASA